MRSDLIDIQVEDYGEDVETADAEKLAAALSKKFSSCDVELYNGGQPIYYYIISVE